MMTDGWEVTTDGMPVTTPAELVMLRKVVKGLVCSTNVLADVTERDHCAIWVERTVKKGRKQSGIQVRTYVGSRGHDLRLAIVELRDLRSCDHGGCEARNEGE